MTEPPQESPSSSGAPSKVHPRTHRRCDNPACGNFIEWREQRGRPPRFCTDRCRQQAGAELSRLQKELAKLDELVDDQLSYRQRRQVTSKRTHLTWLLSAFPRSTSEG